MVGIFGKSFEAETDNSLVTIENGGLRSQSIDLIHPCIYLLIVLMTEVAVTTSGYMFKRNA